MGRATKVVLAYSGRVDTSVGIPYLKHEWGVQEVITLAADLGQGGVFVKCVSLSYDG